MLGCASCIPFRASGFPYPSNAKAIAMAEEIIVGESRDELGEVSFMCLAS